MSKTRAVPVLALPIGLAMPSDCFVVPLLLYPGLDSDLPLELTSPRCLTSLAPVLGQGEWLLEAAQAQELLSGVDEQIIFAIADVSCHLYGVGTMLALGLT